MSHKKAPKLHDQEYLRRYPNVWMDLMSRDEINIQERLVWRVLSEYQGAKDVAFPSHRTLSKVCGLGQRQLRRTVESLEAKGLLIVVHNKKVGRTNNYTVVLPDDLSVRAANLQGSDTEDENRVDAERRHSDNPDAPEV